jgi:hypothetical protein
MGFAWGQQPDNREGAKSAKPDAKQNFALKKSEIIFIFSLAIRNASS